MSAQPVCICKDPPMPFQLSGALKAASAQTLGALGGILKK
jgi:hypothetical protein